LVEAIANERRADATPLVFGKDGERAQHLNLDQSLWCVEQAAGEHDVPDDLPLLLGDYRQRGWIIAT
jgi:hypothetical protein